MEIKDGLMKIKKDDLDDRYGLKEIKYDLKEM